MSDGCDENTVQQTDPIVVDNPYSLPKTYGLDSIKKQQLLADSNKDVELLIDGDKTSALKPDDEVNSLSSVDDPG